MSGHEHAIKARQAATRLLAITEETRVAALDAISAALRQQCDAIIAENAKDLARAEENKLSEALIDRLRLTSQSVTDMALAVESIARQPDVIGIHETPIERADGLQIIRQHIPLGVIAIIFESRPNVVVDCAALAIKSGNAVILKGGREALASNTALGKVITAAIRPWLPENSVQVLDSADRELTQDLMKEADCIDLLIPRGGPGLIQYVKENSRIPVVAHDRGLCHIYVHASADLRKAQEVTINAKCQRPGVCNALETLLVDRAVAEAFLPDLARALVRENITLKVCPTTLALLSASGVPARSASESDWDSEYLDRVLSIRTVNGLKEAVDHIQRHGSRHTEGILAEDDEVIQSFINHVDASCITVNASTRFNDGGQLGLGAEVGISTSKLHAYGPMGARELTTSRFVVVGKGHVRV